MKTIEKTLIRQVNDLAGPDCLNLGLGEPGFPTPAPILAHVRDHVHEWRHGYTANEGLRELREAIAASESEAVGTPIAPERVIATVGSEEALFVTLATVVEPGDEVLVPDPGYPAYASVVRLIGGSVATYPLRPENRFRLKAADVLAALTPRTRALIVNSPNNPTGAMYEDAELAALAAGLAGRDVVAVSDECYRSLTYGARPASLLRHHPATVLVNSLSKGYSMTGWRLGWMIYPPEWTSRLAGAHQMAVTCASVVSQRAGLFALRGGADAEKAAMREELGRRRELAVRELARHAGIAVEPPEGSFYLFVDARRECEAVGGSLALCRRLVREAKVVVIPGVAFGPGGEGWVRISFAAEPATISAGLERFGRFLATLR